MTEFDDRLRGALSADDEAFLNNLEDERGLFAQMGDTFSGPLKYWTAFAFALSLTFFGLGVYCFIRIFSAEGPNAIAAWLGGFIAAMISVGLVKLWFWLRMNHLATLRELKKMELRIAKMSDGA
ncbi:MAG: DUF6768 family protein [Pseudomonadota bacterium]